MKTPRLPRLAIVSLLALAPAALTAQTVININPSADSWVRSGTPTQNNGTSGEMLVGTINPTSGGTIGADVSGADVGRIVLSFDLSAPSVVSALSGLTITSVTLTFTVNSSDVGNGTASNTVSYNLFNTAAFTGSTVTWNTRPAPSGSAVSTLSTNPATLAAGNTVTFGNSVSFTSLVEASRGGTLNLLVKQATEGNPAAREILRLRTVDFTGTASDPVLTITAIPEPSSIAALFGLGTLGFVATRRRRA
jgi:hypothetical protein